MIRPKLTCLLPLLALQLSTNAAPICDDMAITVHAEASAQNISLPDLNIDLTNRGPVEDLLNPVLGAGSRLLPLIPVSGTYNISARYCEPTVNNENSQTVQILVHGATYTKTYWTGLDLPDKRAERYSWVDYASQEGYATLSIDRLGTGKSTHADPILEVQMNLDAETIHEVIKKLRAGEIKGKKFNKIVFVGHSLGSSVGSALSLRHPNDIDALILTGWSDAFFDNTPRILSMGFLPAVIADINKWEDRAIGYLTTTVEENVRRAFYGPDGSFDPQVRAGAWRTRDIVAIAEALSVLTIVDVSADFTGPVHILNGEFDAIVCDNSGRCKNGPNNIPASSSKFFPNSRNYTYHIVLDTGHNLNLHYSTHDSYQVAHDFLRYNL